MERERFRLENFPQTEIFADTVILCAFFTTLFYYSTRTHRHTWLEGPFVLCLCFLSRLRHGLFCEMRERKSRGLSRILGRSEASQAEDRFRYCGATKHGTNCASSVFGQYRLLNRPEVVLPFSATRTRVY